MAKAFNLTVELNLRGPSNLRPVVNNMKKQLQSVGKTNLNVAIDKKSLASLELATKKTRDLAKALNDAASGAASLNRSLSGTSSVLNAQAGAAVGASRSMGGLQKQAASTVKTTKKLTDAGNALRRAFNFRDLAKAASFSAVNSLLSTMTGFVRDATRAYLDFDRELIKVQQVTNTTRSGISALSEEIRRLSVGLGVSSADLVSVSLTLAQTGRTANEVRVALRAISQATLSPTFGDMKTTTEGVIAALQQFSIATGRAEEVLDSINAVASRFAVESNDIINAVQRTGGVFAASSKGISEGTDALNEFIAVFTSVRATTRESAETIAVGLKTVFTRLQRLDTATKLKDILNVDVFEEGQFIGPYKAIQRISQAIQQLGIDTRDIEFSQLVEALGGVRQVGKVIPLLQQFGTAQEALNVAQNSSGSTAKDAEKAQFSLAVQLQKTREAWNELYSSFAENSAIKAIATLFVSVTRSILGFAKSLAPFAPLIAGLAVAKTVKFGAGLFKGASQGTKEAGGVGGLGTKLGKKLTGAASPTKQAQREVKALKQISLNTKAIHTATSATELLTTSMSTNTEALQELSALVSSMLDNKPDQGDGNKPGFARGGVVPGSGNRDTVSAMLTPGEFVIRKKAVEAIGADKLHQMNKYAKGGIVQRFAQGGEPDTNGLVDLPSDGPTHFTHLDEGITSNPQFEKLGIRKVYTNMGMDLPAAWNLDWASNIKDQEGAYYKSLGDYIRNNDVFKTLLSAGGSSRYGFRGRSGSDAFGILAENQDQIKSNLASKLKGKSESSFFDIDDQVSSKLPKLLSGVINKVVGDNASTLMEGLEDPIAYSKQGKSGRKRLSNRRRGILGLAQGGPILETDTVGAAIMEDIENYSPIVTAQDIAAATSKGRQDEGAIYEKLIGALGSRSYTIRKSGLAGEVNRLLNEKMGSGSIDMVNGILESMGLDIVEGDENQQNLLTTMNAGMRGAVFETVLTAIKQGGVYSKASQSNNDYFDYTSGLGSAAKLFQGLEDLNFVDAKLSLDAAHNANIARKIGNEILRSASGLTPEQITEMAPEGDAITNLRSAIAANLGSMTNFNRGKKIPLPGTALATDGRFTDMVKAILKAYDSQDLSVQDGNDLLKQIYNVRHSNNFGGEGFALNDLVKKFATGGSVEDTVPAMLTPGEFVINKKAASRIGGAQLERLNKADKIQGFNKGGGVGFVQRFAVGGEVEASAIIEKIASATNRSARDAAKALWTELRGFVKQGMDKDSTNREKGSTGRGVAQFLIDALKNNAGGNTKENKALARGLTGSPLGIKALGGKTGLLSDKASIEVQKAILAAIRSSASKTEKLLADLPEKIEVGEQIEDSFQEAITKALGKQTGTNNTKQVNIDVGAAKSRSQAKLNARLERGAKNLEQFGEYGKLVKNSPFFQRAASTRAVGGLAKMSKGLGKLFKGIGGLRTLGAGVAVQAIQDFALTEKQKKDPTIAAGFGGVKGALAGAAAGGALLGPVGAAGGALLGAINGIKTGFEQAKLAQNLKAVSDASSKLERAFEKLNANVAGAFEESQTAFGEVLIAQSNIEADAVRGGFNENFFKYPETFLEGFFATTTLGLGPAIASFFQGSSTTDASRAELAQSAKINLENAKKMGQYRAVRMSDEQYEQSQNRDMIVEQYAESEAKARTGKDLSSLGAEERGRFLRDAQKRAALDAYRAQRTEQGADASTIQKEINQEGARALRIGKGILADRQKITNAEIAQQRAAKEAAKIIAANIDIYNRLAANLQRAGEATDYFISRIDDYTNMTQGTKVDRRNEQILGNLLAYSPEEVQAAAAPVASALGGGQRASDLAGNARVAKILQEDLPKQLRAAKTPEQRQQVIQGLRDQFSNMGLDSTAIKDVLAQIANTIEENADIGTLLEEIDTGIVGQFSKAVEQAQTALVNAMTEYNNNLQKLIDQQQKYTQALARSREFLTKAGTIRIDAENRLAEALGRNVSLEQMNASIDMQTRSQTQGLVDRGLILPDEATDPKAIAKGFEDLRATNERLIARNEQIRADQGMLDPNDEASVALSMSLDQEYRDNQRAIISNNQALQDSRAALENMANSTAKADNALKKLEQANKEVAGGADFLQKVLTNTPGQNQQIVRELDSFRRASAGENMNTRQGREQAFAGLELMKGLGLSDAEYGAARATMMENMLTQQGVDLNQQVTVGENQFTIKELLERMKNPEDSPEVKAYKEATQEQIDANVMLADIEHKNSIRIAEGIEAIEQYFKVEFPNALKDAIDGASEDPSKRPGAPKTEVQKELDAAKTEAAAAKKEKEEVDAEAERLKRAREKIQEKRDAGTLTHYDVDRFNAGARRHRANRENNNARLEAAEQGLSQAQAKADEEKAQTQADRRAEIEQRRAAQVSQEQAARRAGTQAPSVAFADRGEANPPPPSDRPSVSPQVEADAASLVSILGPVSEDIRRRNQEILENPENYSINEVNAARRWESDSQQYEEAFGGRRSGGGAGSATTEGQEQAFAGLDMMRGLGMSEAQYGAARANMMENMLTQHGIDLNTQMSVGENQFTIKDLLDNMRGGSSVAEETVRQNAENSNVYTASLSEDSLAKLTEFNNNFATYVDKLVTFEFPTIPETIELNANHVVEVRFTGAAALESMSAQMSNMVVSETNKAMAEIWEQSGGNYGRRPQMDTGGGN
jgi:TP901 family phage tail tape measure protein